MKTRFLLLLLLPLCSAAPLGPAGEDKKVDRRVDHVGTSGREDNHSAHDQRGTYDAVEELRKRIETIEDYLKKNSNSREGRDLNGDELEILNNITPAIEILKSCGKSDHDDGICNAGEIHDVSEDIEVTFGRIREGKTAVSGMLLKHFGRLKMEIDAAIEMAEEEITDELAGMDKIEVAKFVDGTCYADDRFRFLLDELVHYSATNSPDECIETCASRGYSYAGVQYSHECFCGNHEPPASRIRDSSQCRMKCPGDSRLNCGGDWKMNIFAVKTDSCLDKPCGAECDTSYGMLQVMRYCQPDGSCTPNAQPDCRGNEDEDNGEEVCQGHGYDEGTCNAIECCHFGDGQCWSSVGQQPCWTSDCPANHFSCLSGECIHQKGRCNGLKDCSDGSDEETCHDYVCPGDRFKCSYGTCIKGEFRCDGDKDCKDGLDEYDCEDYVCPADRFKCSSGECIKEDWRCDDYDDCKDGSDEYDCEDHGEGDPEYCKAVDCSQMGSEEFCPIKCAQRQPEFCKVVDCALPDSQEFCPFKCAPGKTLIDGPEIICNFDDNLLASPVRPNLPFFDSPVEETSWSTWTDGKIPYYFSGAITDGDKQLFREIMDEIELHTCFEYIPHNKEPSEHHLEIVVKAPSCSMDGNPRFDAHVDPISDIKVRLLSKYQLTDNENCDYKGGIFHEMMHVHGVMHTHNRVDRDEYITVHKQNIKIKKWPQYEICETCTLFEEIPYDCDSIMHYGFRTSSIDGKATMESKDSSKCRLTELGPSFSGTKKPARNDWKLLKMLARKVCHQKPLCNAGETNLAACYCEVESSGIGVECSASQRCTKEGNCFNVCPVGQSNPVACYCEAGSSGNFVGCSASQKCTLDGTCLGEDAAIHGGWSSWSQCSGTCKKNAVKTRTCTNPAPKHGGLSCLGSSSSSCNQDVACPIDGGWTSFGACTKTCEGGVTTRTCTNPSPKHGGKSCVGDDTKPCNEGVQCTPPELECYAEPTIFTFKLECANGNLAYRWNGCIYQDSVRVRCPKGYYPCNRLKRNGKEFYCSKTCWGWLGGKRDCYQAINGGWSTWSQCSRTCKGNGVQTRTCTNPEPKYGGDSCSGSSYRSCNQNIYCRLPEKCSASDPQFIPHATDCQKYYQCAPGLAPVEYSCAGPTRWNTKINNCDYGDVECASDPSGPSEKSDGESGLPKMCSTSDPQFFPHVDCQKYYQCAPGHAPVEYSCGGTARWNTKINNCDYGHVECASGPSGKSDGESGLPKMCSISDPEFFPHADCQKYYQCAPGHAPVEYSCGGTNRWNTKINNCDSAHNVECASNPLEIGTLFEDDMILNQEQLEWLKAGLLYGELDGAIVNETHTVKENMQNSIIDPKKLWPNHIVYYSFDDTLTSNQKDTVRSILATLQEKLSSCLAFEERNQGNRISVGRGFAGCFSWVGYQDKKQELNLANGCFDHDGIIEHEFLHAVGLHHTQSRWDRDDYVVIKYDNIPETKHHNFNSFDAATISHYGLPYDYESVMHYAKSDFSKWYNGITIETLDPSKQDVIGQRNGVSAGDIQLVRRAYGCDLAVKCLASPDYPLDYPNDFDRTETLDVPNGHTMEITFRHFDIEAHPTCYYDYLKFFDGNSNAIGKKMCGDSLPQKFQIPTSTASVVFHSDGSVTKKGYKFCYSPVKCHTSPNYPQNYPNNRNVRETLSVEAGRAMEITFHSFSVEDHDECNYDYLEFEFINETSNTVTEKLCGTSLPQKFTIPSSTASAVFHSDFSVRKKGYKFCYSPVEWEET